MSTVLVVDDSALDRRLAAGLLEDAGLQVTYAAHGRAALDMLSADEPDLILTDLQMPELDGLELVQEVRKRHSTIPVVLMTAHGSEEIAVTALKTGAASYVPKRNLAKHLLQTVQVVLDAARASRRKRTVLECLDRTESSFVLGSDPAVLSPLVEHLQDGLRQMSLCAEAELVRIGTALHEALLNGIEHGNLELDSALREAGDSSYARLAAERRRQPPYRDRRLYVTARFTRTEAVWTIRDEGPGFDPTALPDPTRPENIERASGRGLLLIRLFMDDVAFNPQGNEATLTKRATVEA